MSLSVPILRRPLPLATALLLLTPGAHPVWARQDISVSAPAGEVANSTAAATGGDSVQSSIAPPEAREVLAWGRAAIGPGGLDAARQAAKAHALRDAVEKATGVFVSARTLTHNYELVHDQVMTHAEGFATLKDVVSEVVTPQTVTITMRAVVSLRPLAQELKALNLTRAWRIRVSAVDPTEGTRDPAHDQAAVEALEKTLLDAGFVVVSNDNDADIAVHVTPQFAPVAEAARDERGMPHSLRNAHVEHAIRGDISVRATRAQTGEVVAVLSASETASQVDTATAGANAVAGAVQAVAPRLADALMLLPARDSQPVQLVIRGIGTAARATHLENLLGGLTGVRSVTRRSYEGGDAVWEMDVLSEAQSDLAREMEESAPLKPFKLRVTSDTLAKIVVWAPFGRHPAIKPKPAVLAANVVPEPVPAPVAAPQLAPYPAETPSGYRSLHPDASGVAAKNGGLADMSNRYRVNPRDGAQMVWVPQGAFQMGDDDMGNNPRHTVMLSGYFIYKDLVTVAMYRKFCEATGHPMPFAPRGGWRNEQPIVNVTYANTCDYCTWAGVRLPTEAEWEKAARGTDGRKFPWGDDFQTSHPLANFHSSAFGGVSLSIESRNTSFPSASPYGVKDMNGKVLQWCADWYDSNFVRFSRPEDPTGPYRAKDRVVRGCPANDHSVVDYRAARRLYAPPTAEVSTIGFRAVAAPVRWARSGGE